MDIQADKRQENIGHFTHWWGWLMALPGMLRDKIVKFAKSTKKLGQDDPRRIIHSFKVGLALTVVSLLYYIRPLYDDFGTSGMWAVLTVVVVFEYTAGGTLSKSLNRGFATLLAGALGVGAKHLASLFEKEGEPIVLGILVFVLGAGATFARFFPKIKARYDYGVLIFILTFSLVSVSGYRVDEILTLAYQRLLTIIIGGATCIFISMFICPVWAGETLHNSVALNVEKLANYLEGFGGEYFQNSQNGDIDVSKKDKSSLQGYKSVIASKGTEESMANLASWEPRHGKFRFRHPWKQYLKVGELARKCACHIEALNGYLYSDVQAPEEFKRKIQEPCMKISSETGKALKVLASAIKAMKDPSPAESHIDNAKHAVTDLKVTLKFVALEYKDLLTIVPATSVASLLIEIGTCVEKISESVHELSQQANFKKVEPTVSPEKPHLLHRGTIKPVLDGDNSSHVIITVNETSTDQIPENCKTYAANHSQLHELVLCN